MPSISPKTILVVEDDQDILFSIASFLELENYVVRTANNGFEALSSLKTEGIPDLILIDMKMPVMDGWEFSLAFHEKYDHKAPLVVMTAAADAEKRAKEIHASGWVGKPFSFDNLLSIVRAHER